MDDENFLDKLKKGGRSMFDKFILESFDLVQAAEKGETQIVERALRTGMKPDSPDGLGRIPLSMAVDTNRMEIIRMLLKFGANPNLLDHEGNTALIKAVEWAHHDMIVMMMDHGGDFNFKNKKGVSALDVAKGSNDSSLVDRLEKHKTLSKEDYKKQELAKHERQKAEAAEARKKQEAARKEREADELKKQEALEKVEKEKAEKIAKEKEVIQQKIAENKLTDLVTKYKVKEIGGTAALILAIRAKDGEAIKTFIDEQKVDLNKLNEEGESPLSESINHAKLFDALCDAGADPFLSIEGKQAPIVSAIQNGTIGILPVLKSNGNDLNKKASGRTLIEWAVRFNRIDWVNGLKAEGADMKVIDSDGKSLLDLAKEHKADQGIIDLLG